MDWSAWCVLLRLLIICTIPMTSAFGCVGRTFYFQGCEWMIRLALSGTENAGVGRPNEEAHTKSTRTTRRSGRCCTCSIMMYDYARGGVFLSGWHHGSEYGSHRMDMAAWRCKKHCSDRARQRGRGLGPDMPSHNEGRT